MSPSKLVTHRLASWIGALGTGAACIYVVYGFISTRALEHINWFSAATWITLLVCAVSYALLQLLLVFSWRGLLVGTGSRLPPTEAVEIYSISQIYKYLPTNILHQVGRYSMLRARAIDRNSIIFAASAEAVLMMIASAALSGLLGVSIFKLAATQVVGAGIVLPMALATAGVGIVLVSWWAFKRPIYWPSTSDHPKAWIYLPLALAGYIVYFFCTGSIGNLLLATIQQQIPAVTQGQIVAILSAAWVIGFITPGASAGIGVREAVIALSFGSLGSMDVGLALAGIYRVTTLAGDLLFTVIGWTIYASRKE